MAKPPSKKSKPSPRPSPTQGPPQGPPQGPMPSDFDGDEAMGGMPGAPQFGGAAMPMPMPNFGPPPTTRPGQGMDPILAMMQGLGTGVPAPLGSNGLPVGGRLPGPMDELGGEVPPDMGGSQILQLLLQGGLTGNQGMSQQDAMGGMPGMSPMGGMGGQEETLDLIMQLLSMLRLGGGDSQASGIPDDPGTASGLFHGYPM